MEELHQDVKEAINLIVRQGDQAIYVEKIDTFQKVRLYTAIGRSSPLYAGACSQIILSHLSDSYIAEYLEKTELQQFGNGTFTDRESLLVLFRRLVAMAIRLVIRSLRISRLLLRHRSLTVAVVK